MLVHTVWVDSKNKGCKTLLSYLGAPSVTAAGQGQGQTPACSVLRPPGLEAEAEQVCKALGREGNEKVMVGCKIELIRQENEEGIRACPSRRPAAWGSGGGLAALASGCREGRKRGMVPSSKIASAPPLAAEGAPAFADKGLLKAEAQKCGCSEAFLLLFRLLSLAV